MSEPNHSRNIIKSEQTDRQDLPPSSSQTWSVAFKCEFCDKEFHLKDHLIQHVSESHQLSLNNIVKTEGSNSSTLIDTKRSLQCNSCDKSFKFKSKLVEHLRSHSDER
eukprot:1103369_1